jgi:uncharacterized protein (TIGR02117 family)
MLADRSSIPYALRLRRALRPVVRAAVRAALLVLSLVTLYIAIGTAAAFFPINRDFVQPANGIDIFIASNGVHTDLVLPVRAAGIDWRDILPLGNVKDPDIAPTHIGFGWGDRAFYLETRRWQDVKIGTALKSLFGLGPSALHVVWQARPLESDNIRRVRITPVELAHLVRYIRADFATDAAGKPRRIPGAAYHAHDAFYEAHGSYSLILTCNEWLRRALADAGIRTALWAPFDYDLLRTLPVE